MNVTDTAVIGLNNLKIGEKTLTVRRAQPKHQDQQQHHQPASQGFQSFAGDAGLTPAQLGALAALRAQGGIPPVGMPMHAPPPTHSSPTRILVLLHMVVPDMLRDDQEYKEIYEDIHLECQRYGQVRSVVIPRPRPDGMHVAGLGKVFVEFGQVDEAMKARAEVEGRAFDGRKVSADFWNEERYARGDLD